MSENTATSIDQGMMMQALVAGLSPDKDTRTNATKYIKQCVKLKGYLSIMLQLSANPNIDQNNPTSSQ